MDSATANCYSSHGTACGGVIFSDHNENFIAGISPDCSLLNVCNSLTTSYIDRFATAINWAVQNKADVINNSWGDQGGLYYSIFHTAILEEAIDNALINGRGGKGCIVVFAAGNHAPTIDYPGNYRPEIMVVGGMNSLGYRNDSSAYGEILDLVAPGLNIYTTVLNHSYEYAHGTSLAAPYVSGVAALVLSVNPCLTREEVTYILESTCTKMRPDLYPYGNNPNHPNGTWNIEVGHGLVNAYEAVLLAQQMGGYVFRSQTEIQSNTLWDTASLINDDLIIDSLATLTITDTLYIAGGSRIIVRPGGTLVVNGGTLTNACDGEMWEGIIVEGNADQRQITSKQGSVILTNATIENAFNAISTRGAENNDTQYAKSGGIVQATNTLFRNNIRSAEFLLYENHKSNGTVTNNVSYFTRCTFTIDDDNLFAENDAVFKNHVSLWKVRGVKFNGCTFRNETTTTIDSSRGKAIYTEKAGFIAQRVCPMISQSDPCYCEPSGSNPVTRCSFEGFHKAVHSNSTLGNYDITIDNCDFAQNHVGVELDAAANSRVSFCDFDLSDTVSYCGIELNNSTGYTVEENMIHRPQTSNDYKVSGIVVNESGTAENFIRKNSFSNINIGIAATGTNALDIRTKIPGLQFECNSFTNSKTDISVSNGTIRGKQGSASAGADNVFNDMWLSQSIVLSDANNITYYYSNGTNHAPYNPSTGVTSVGNATANSCVSTLCGSQLPPSPPGPLLSRYRSMAEELQALSDTFRLRGYREEEMSDNAEAAALLAQISDLSAALGDLSRTAIRAVLSDTVVDMSLLKEWYRTLVETFHETSLRDAQPSDIPVSAYHLAEVYSHEGDYAAANALLSTLPERFNPDEAARNEYANYLSLQRLREAVSGNWYRQTDTEIAELQQVAEYDGGRAARMAKGILCFFHHVCYEDEPLPELEGMGERNARRDAVHHIATTDGTLTLHPNPAHNTLTVESASAIREIAVYDMAGHAVMVETCHGASLRHDLNLSSLHAGIYLVKVVTANGTETAKFVKN